MKKICKTQIQILPLRPLILFLNLIIDIGNTAAKLTLFEKQTRRDSFVLHSPEADELTRTCQSLFEKYSIRALILSSVRKHLPEFERSLKQRAQRVILFDENTKIPIKNTYQTPGTLGKDRLAAAIGANNLYPRNNILIFDAGSALTVDFVDKNKEYHGGCISPGIDMRFKAMHQFTEKLPLKTRNVATNRLFARSTGEAIISGVQNGVCFEIERYIDEFAGKYEDTEVILTGGDAPFLYKKITKKTTLHPHLVSEGLNTILLYNE